MFEEDKVILWDTEFTSWPGCNEKGWDSDEGEYREIIQIGAVKADTETMEEYESFNKFVSPKINSQLSDYIKELTGITQEDVDQADELKSVLKDFIEWSEGLTAYSVGDDWTVIENNLVLLDENVDVQRNRFKDVREIFKAEDVPIDEWHSGDVARYIDERVDLLPKHNALNDAKNMLKALQLLK